MKSLKKCPALLMAAGFVFAMTACSHDPAETEIETWVPETTTVMETSETSETTIIIETVTDETTKETFRYWEDTSFVEPYIEIIDKCEADEEKDYQYSLFFIDEDLIPELCVFEMGDDEETFGGITLYTFKDDKAVTVINDYQYDQGFNNFFAYAPQENFIYHIECDSENIYVTEIWIYDLEGLMNNEPLLTGHYDYDTEAQEYIYFLGEEEVDTVEYYSATGADLNFDTMVGTGEADDIKEILESGIIPL